MKKTTVFLLAFIFSSISILAQDENPKKWDIKAYWNASYQQENSGYEFTTGNSQIYNSKSFDFNDISIAASLNKKNLFHEFELVELRIRTRNDILLMGTAPDNSIPISGSRVFQNSLKLRYSFGYHFKPFKNKFLTLGLGASSSLYYSYWKSTPVTSASFPISTFIIGKTISVIPHFHYDMHKRVYLSVSLPFDLLDMNIVTNKENNPTLSPEEKNQQSLNTTFQPKVYHLRLGIGVRI